MNRRSYRSIWLASAILLIVSLACGATAPATATPVPPTNPPAATATNVPKPSATLEPSATPDVAMTQMVDAVNTLVQGYYDRGYLTTNSGTFTPYNDFKSDWAQLGWYQPSLLNQQASDFFIGAHVKWSTASKTPDLSGCGYEFAIQQNG